MDEILLRVLEPLVREPAREARCGKFSLRVVHDRAVRAPNLIELYVAPSFGQEAVFGNDPCAQPATASLKNCENTHVTPAEYGNGTTTDLINNCVSGQCGQVIEGNSALKPEVAKTWSAGLTFTPVELPGFTASVDYYHIRLEDEIGTYPFSVIFNGCLNNANPIYCSQIVRQPTNGSLTGSTTRASHEK